MKPKSFTWEGDGSSQNPYQIKSRVHLEGLASEVSWGEGFQGAFFRLMNDLDLQKKEWKVIGNIDNHFLGNFDGGGHTLLNLYLSRAKTDSGLFGVIGESGVVENLNLTGELVVRQANNTMAMIAGSNWGTIRNCRCTEVCIAIQTADTDKKNHTGILVGINQVGAEIESCVCEGSFGLDCAVYPQTAEPLLFIGGAAGANHSQKGITHCSVSIGKSFRPLPPGLFRAGGLTGKNDAGGSLLECSASGNLFYGEGRDGPQEEGGVLFTEAGNGRSMLFTEEAGVVSISEIPPSITEKENAAMKEERNTIVTYNTPLYIGDGEEVVYHQIAFLPGGYIVFDGDGTLLVDEVVEGKEDTDADGAREGEHLEVPAPPIANADIILLAAGKPAPACDGEDGKPGGDGGSGFSGGSGGCGEDGQKGEDGENGAAGPTVKIVINNLKRDLVIANVGAQAGDGGVGGNGGRGGRGGDGVAGGDGGPGGDGGDGGGGPMNNKKTNYQLKCGHIKPLRNGC